MKRKMRAGKGRRMGAAAGFFLLLHAVSAGAHPHVFVEYSVMLPVGPQRIEGIGFAFAFDALASTMIRYTTESRGPATVVERHASVLRQLPHEIEVTYNGVPVMLDQPIDLEVTEADGKFTYRFRVPLKVPLVPPGTLDISVQDHGLFAAFAVRPFAPVEVQASGPETASCERALTPTGAPGPIRCLYGRAPR
jgi:ABC-type uncharacterized transport system substrate-binding protein